MDVSRSPESPAAPLLFVNYHGTLGGGQVHLLSLLDGLDRRRFTPHVVCCQDGAFADALRARGIMPILVPFGKGKLRYLHVSLPAWWTIHRLIKRLGIRLVHVSGLQEAKLAASPAAWARVPLVWVVAP
jgi:Glycosyltransferase Family 4